MPVVVFSGSSTGTLSSRHLRVSGAASRQLLTAWLPALTALTQGASSTGPAYSLPPSTDEGLASQHQEEVRVGNLGLLLVDGNGHVERTAEHDNLVVADVIGRSVVLYGLVSSSAGPDALQVHSNYTRVAAAVIARSARPSPLNPQLCNCDGSLLWQARSPLFLLSVYIL